LIGRPPVGRARSGAASTQDALIHPIQFLPILPTLQVLLIMVLLGPLRLQPWLNTLVLLIEVSHIGDQVLEDVHMRKRIDLGG